MMRRSLFLPTTTNWEPPSVKFRFDSACSIVVLATLAGCVASGPKFTEIARPIEGKGNVYLFRQTAFYGSGSCPNIFLDTNKIGCLRNGGFFLLELEPGYHEIALTYRRKPTPTDISSTFYVGAGETLFFEYGTKLASINVITTSYGTVAGNELFNQTTDKYALTVLPKLNRMEKSE